MVPLVEVRAGGVLWGSRLVAAGGAELFEQSPPGLRAVGDPATDR